VPATICAIFQIFAKDLNVYHHDSMSGWARIKWREGGCGWGPDFLDGGECPTSVPRTNLLLAVKSVAFDLDIMTPDESCFSSQHLLPHTIIPAGKQVPQTGFAPLGATPCRGMGFSIQAVTAWRFFPSSYLSAAGIIKPSSVCSFCSCHATPLHPIQPPQHFDMFCTETRLGVLIPPIFHNVG